MKIKSHSGYIGVIMGIALSEFHAWVKDWDALAFMCLIFLLMFLFYLKILELFEEAFKNHIRVER